MVALGSAGGGVPGGVGRWRQQHHAGGATVVAATSLVVAAAARWTPAAAPAVSVRQPRPAGARRSRRRWRRQRRQRSAARAAASAGLGEDGVVEASPLQAERAKHASGEEDSEPVFMKAPEELSEV